MVNAYKQREMRDGIKMVWVNLELPSEDENYLVNQYVNAFTSKTKVVHITHIINWNGQIIPVKKIAAEAHKRGIEVIVDGAHALAHFDFKISDLDCDYYGVSLHKWLFAPHGTGLLYVRRDKIKSLLPLMAAREKNTRNIRKVEEIGTHAAAPYLAIAEALTF